MATGGYTGTRLVYEQENYMRYCPGGFHPVSIGDEFCAGRYAIHHKLGFGGFATVWLAKENVGK